MTVSQNTIVEDGPVGLAPFVVAATLLFTAGLVGFAFVRSPLIEPLWPATLGLQMASCGLSWLALCVVSALAARWRRISFSTALLAACLPLGILAAGIATSAVVATVLFDAFLLGSLIQGREPAKPLVAVSTATGLGVMTLAATVTEFWPVNTRLAFAGATLLLPLVLLDSGVRYRVQHLLRQIASSFRPVASPARYWPADLAFAMLAGTLGLHFIFALLPERYYDALAVHLYVPSYIVAHGRWSFDVGNWAFAHMPLSIDFLYAWVYALGGVDAVRLYNFCALVMIACLIVSWLEERASRATALSAALLFVATPLAFITTASLFIENTLTMWITAAALVATTRWNDMTPAASRTVLILLAAVVASKLQGVIAAALIGSVALVAFLRTRPARHQWINFAVVAVLSSACAVVPYVYAWVDTGNPVFPFFNQIFKAPYWPPTAFVDSRWTGHFDWRLLWNATFHSSRLIEGYDGVFGLSLLVFLPVAVLFVLLRGAPSDRLALVVGLGLAIIVASQIQYLRYLFIALPILFVVIGRLIEVACSHPVARGVTLGIAWLCAAAGLFLAPSAGWILAASDVRAAFSREAREQMIKEQAPEQIANRIINTIGGPDARVFYVENPFPALLEGTGLAANWYDRRYGDALAGAKTSQDLGTVLHQMGITHVVIAPGAPSPRRTATTAFLEKNGRLRATIGQVQIYEIGPS